MNPSLRHCALLCTLFIPLPLSAQEDEPKELPSKEARAAVKTFEAGMKGAKTDLKKRLELIETLGAQRSERFVRPLQKVFVREKSLVVKRAAVLAIGKQPGRKVRAYLYNTLKKTDPKKEPDLTAALVAAIGERHFTPGDWEVMEKVFNEVLWLKGVTGLQSSIIELAGDHKVDAAFEFLSQHIDAPAPEWVDDPANPPASEWKKRWENWSSWKTRVVNSLRQISGQTFNTKKEALKWRKENPPKTTRGGKSRGKKKRRR